MIPQQYVAVAQHYVSYVRDESRLYVPMAKTVALAFATAFLVIIGHLLLEPSMIHQSIISVSFCFSLLPFGFVYGLFVEYAQHRWVIHQKTYGFLRPFLEDHMIHHRLFSGDNFQTRDADRLQYVATFWPTFPVLFISNYLVVLVVLHGIGIPSIYGLAFFMGVAIEFIFFEITHFARHVKNSPIDRLFNGKKKRLRHHLHHDKDLSICFGVTSGLFDWLFGTLKRKPTKLT